MSSSAQAFLNAAEESALLKLARTSLTRHLMGEAAPEIREAELSEHLRMHLGAFVTLRSQDTLRGCMGNTRATVSLAASVSRNAIEAGIRDPRFAPVEPEELSRLCIEISVLLPGGEGDTPFLPCASAGEIELGLDGVYLRDVRSGRGTLLLPQVPLEHGMDKAQFLTALCRKGAAPPEAWLLPGYQLYRFRAQVFGESP